MADIFNAARSLLPLSYFLVFLLHCTSSRAFAQPISINAVGDIMLAGKGAAVYARQGYDYPFARVAATLKNADITVGNLEAPITRGGKEFTGKKFRFRTNPKTAAALRRAGFSVVTLANNHMMDYGTVGLQDTLRHLASAAILHAGAGSNLAMARKPALVRSRGKTIAFLAYSLTYPAEFYAGGNRAGTAPGFAAFFTEDIARAKSVADHVIVSFHWGAEKAIMPKSYQVVAAHRAIDAGAEVVIGHHPHVLQGVEWYENGVIFYSLGNFAFGSMSRSSAVGAMARITLDNGIKEVELIPLNVLNSEIRFQPGILSGKRGQAAINHLNRISRQFGTEIRSEGTRFLVVKQKNGGRYAGAGLKPAPTL